MKTSRFGWAALAAQALSASLAWAQMAPVTQPGAAAPQPVASQPPQPGATASQPPQPGATASQPPQPGATASQPPQPGATASQPTASTSESGRIYIAVGSPNVKKVLLAIETTRGTQGLMGDFYATLTNDMDYTDLFEVLPPGRLPPAKALGTIDVNVYRGLGVEFVLQSSVERKANGQVEAQVRLFDVSRGTQILGRAYPLVSASGQPARELAHYAGNDIIQTLTGEPGIFRTRLLMSCGNRTKEIYIMDFDGMNVRQLTQDRNFALSPSWAPDGKRLLFTSYKPAVKGGALNPNLYLYDMSNQQRRLLSAARGLNTGGAFHPRDDKVAYTFSQNGRPEIYVLDLSSNTRRAITKTQFFSVEPAWSPDGTRLAYSSSATGRPHIYVASSEGTNAVRLTFAGVYNSSPQWAPRGDRIVFSGQENKANNFNVFSIDPNGSNLQRLTDGRHSSENPVWSPDGRHIAFSSNQDGQYRIYVMSARGTKIRVLSPRNLGPCKQPSWSPRL